MTDDTKQADFGGSILNPPSDQRVGTPTKQRQAEEEAALSQIAVSAETAMNSIAARMANKLMRTVSQAEDEKKVEMQAREQRAATNAANSSNNSFSLHRSNTTETKTPQRGSSAFGRASVPTKKLSPHADPQYSENTKDKI